MFWRSNDSRNVVVKVQITQREIVSIGHTRVEVEYLPLGFLSSVIVKSPFWQDDSVVQLYRMIVSIYTLWPIAPAIIAMKPKRAIAAARRCSEVKR